jgi:hypothetical protein
MTYQAAGLVDAAIFQKVVQHGHRLVLGQFAAIEGAALAFAEALLARPASQDTGGFADPIAEADAQVVETAASVVGALGVLAAEGFQVVHSSLPCSEEGKSCLAAGVTLIKPL